MRHLAFLLVLLLVPASVLAANRTVKVRGIIGLCGTDQCGIGMLNQGYNFSPHSEIANKVFSKCMPEEDCEITGIVDDKDYFVSVSRVRSINTNIEPSAAIIVDAASWLFSLQDQVKDNHLSIYWVDLLSIGMYYKDSMTRVWHVKVIIHGYKDHKSISVGPGGVYLMKHQGKWQYTKTRP